MADRTTITISSEAKSILDYVRDRFFPGTSYDELIRKLCTAFVAMYSTVKTARTVLNGLESTLTTLGVKD